MSNEFALDLFARFYEPISDSFIDTRGAADSLKAWLPARADLFEIGLGTGHFASFLTSSGYTVRGIQPRDALLPQLRQNHPTIEVVAETTLEDYAFDKQHEYIVSHSSVFLFTKITAFLAQSEEAMTSYIFQSFIKSRQDVITCLRKTLTALTPSGRLFINIQRNPLPIANIETPQGQLTFKMANCEYFLDLNLVEKTFHLTYQNDTHVLDDVRYCQTFAEFISQVNEFGSNAIVSNDRRWVVVTRSA
jgi:hypothetical protein